MYKKFKESKQQTLEIRSTVQNVKIDIVGKTETQLNSNQDLISGIEMFMLTRRDQ